jgi:serine/threonine protein kinase
MNSHDNRQPELDDPRVVAALDEYVAALEAGHKPDRRAFLARHADIADALAECLEGMEALHQANSATQPCDRRDATAGDWQPGLPLGDYRIVREIGRGGMGVVYEAEQLSLGRRIALKVLPFALTLDPRQLQRFKNEARAAAQLHHQHIVPVYAVGSERGVHFYAMQYIEGQSLAEVIQDRRQQVGPASRRSEATAGARRFGVSTGPYLPQSAVPATETAVKPTASLATAYSDNSSGFYRTVARLGIQAAEALEHAHQYGVVHRDIKPSNLLVDAHGHLWITDFGLAQFQNDAGLTQSGDLLGTLRYMSPEQAGGQRTILDHRTDIYSLGATLYELLTLHPPFEGNDRHTLLHQILNDEPRSLRGIQKSIPVELETIVLKALAKTPSERYSTAREMADDLGRFLNDQPIRARRATTMQRLRKWGRRHPSVVWAAVLLCLLTAAGSLVSAEMVREEQKKTEAAYEQEKQRAQEAKKEFELAREAMDGMIQVCEQELADKPFLENLRRRLLEEFLLYNQKLIEQRRDDPTAQAEWSATLDRVKHIRDDLIALQGGSQHRLLTEPLVLDDLGANEEQRKQISELMERPGDLGFPWEPSFRKRLLEMAHATKEKLPAILTAAQLDRLRQIDLQRKGVLAFEEPEVIKALALTSQQREQIQSIHGQWWAQWFAGFCNRGEKRDAGWGEPAKPRPPRGSRVPQEASPPEALVKQIVDQVLKEQQKQRWAELTGAPAPQPPKPFWKGPPGPFGGPPKLRGPGPGRFGGPPHPPGSPDYHRKR